MAVKLRIKEKAAGEKSLYLDIYHQGKRSYEFLSLYLTGDRQKDKEVLRLAEEILAKRQLEYSANDYQITPQFKKKADFINYFKGLSESKNRTWHTVLLHLIDFAGDTLSFRQVDEQWLRSFQKYLLNKTSANSSQTYYNKIKAALRQAKRDKIIQNNPAESVDNIKGEDVERVFLTLEEVRLLANTPSDREEVKRAFLFACFTGLRLSDIVKLRWKNIEGDKLKIIVKKTRKHEYMPLSVTAQTFLVNRGKDDEQVFKMVKSEDAIWTALQRWTKAAGIKKHVSFHVSRHTFATLALTSNIDLYTVSKLLGHTSIKNTQIYARIIDSKKTEEIGKLPLL